MFCFTILAPKPGGNLPKVILSLRIGKYYKNAVAIRKEYGGASNFSYEDFDIKDKQKFRFLELGIVDVPVCLVSF